MIMVPNGIVIEAIRICHDLLFILTGMCTDKQTDRQTDLHVWHYSARQVTHESSLGQLIEDDDRQTEEQNHEVPEGHTGQHTVPRVLQVIVVPHDTHEREIAHDPHGEHDERQQHDRVRAVRLLRQRV